MAYKGFGTKLTLNVKYPVTLGPDFMVQTGLRAWDPSIEQMFDMFEALLLSQGFHQDTIDNHICSMAAEIEMLDGDKLAERLKYLEDL
jgi:hypothetical protein